MKKQLVLMVILLHLAISAQAQQWFFEGKITSSLNAAPLANVNVKVLGSNVSTLTNTVGGFKFYISKSVNKIQLSLIGYKTLTIDVEWKQDQFFNFELEPDIEMLQEVTVSTGYQLLPKERATGSFTVIDNKTYNQQIGTNVLERLRTITNGVAPISDKIKVFGDDAMLIRGMSTLTLAIQKPLIIVDNFEYQGDINNINPNDIENVNFLKDAAAGSIWGAKAANGVIVITTKKGKFEQTLKIALTTNLTWAAAPDLFYDQTISGADLVQVEKLLFSKNYRFTDTARANRPPFSPAYELMFQHKSGRLSNTELESQLAQLGRHDVRNDFNNYFYRQMANQQHALWLSGGSSQMAWSLGLGADKNISNLDARYNRYTVRWENEVKVNPKLNLKLAAAYTYSNSRSGAPGYGSFNFGTGTLPIYTSFADANGGAQPLYAYFRQGYIDNIGAGKLLDWRFYPLEDYKQSVTNGKINDLNATIGLDYTIIPELNLSFKYRIQRQSNNSETLHTLQSYTARNLINSFTQVNATTGVPSYILPKGAVLDFSEDNLSAQNLRGQLNFTKNWQQQQLNILAGNEWTEKTTVFNGDRRYGYDPDILLFNAVDVVNPYPSYMTGGQLYIPNLANMGGTNNRFVSFYTNAAYSYKQRYTISASARRDASNLFGVATNDRWKPLWSVGAAWDVRQEQWFKADALQHLKLRASYGKQGNIDPRKVAVTTISYQANNNFTRSFYSQINNYPNPDLRWEEVAMLNIGLDFSAFNRRFSGSIEHYSKRMNDLYATVPIDLTTGIGPGAVLRNIGEAKGQGWDIQLRGQSSFGKFFWHKDFIFNTYTDRVTKLGNEATLGKEAMSTGFTILEGYSPSSLFAYKWAGLDGATGDPVGYIEGQKTKDYNTIVNQTALADAVYIGQQMPKYFGSLGTSFVYKDLELALRFTFKFDYFFRRNSIDYNALVTKLQGHADYAKRWRQEGDEQHTNVPSLVYPLNNARDDFYRNAEILFERGDHIRLQYINLSYQLSPTVYPWVPFKAMKFSFAANQLPILWRANKLALDPEAGTLQRTSNFSFALNVDF